MIRNLIFAFLCVGACLGQRVVWGQSRSYNGIGNNVANPTWGAAGSQLARIAPTAYSDGYASPAGAGRPSARLISNIGMEQPILLPNHYLMTGWVFQWGQFVDHDIDLTGAADPAESFNIPIPMGDPDFDPGNTGTQEMAFSRSLYDTATGIPGKSRQQINQITSYLDGSVIYGSDELRAMTLRTGIGGRLKTSDVNLLPLNTFGLDNATGGNPDPTLFYASGDVRVNEQVGLSAIHTLMMRQHNLLADEIAGELAAANGDWTEEQLDEATYQRARKLVGAQIQVITYKEFLPALLGPYAPSVESTYDLSVDASILNAFSTIVYRFGHTMLPPHLMRMTNDGDVAQGGPMPLSDAFFKPNSLASQGELEYLLKGLASEEQQEVDMHVVDEVRNFLFGAGAGGFDLAALNIQRGRDHGLPDYNTLRVAFGLPAVTTFAEISSDPAVQSALELLYDNVNDIDGWAGAIAEDHLWDAAVGPLVAAGMVEQFTRLRDGDSFWYRNDPALSPDDIAWLESTQLSDIIRANTSITNIQNNVFFMPVPEPGSIFLLVCGAGLAGVTLRRRRGLAA